MCNTDTGITTCFSALKYRYSLFTVCWVLESVVNRAGSPLFLCLFCASIHSWYSSDIQCPSPIFHNMSDSIPCSTVCALVVLSGTICWWMLIMAIRRRKTTTRSSKSPNAPLKCPGRASNGDTKDAAAPNPHSATLSRKRHTKPPMFPKARNTSSTKKGASKR